MSQPDLMTELATAHQLQDKGLQETLRDKFATMMAKMRMCIEDGHPLHHDVYEDARDLLTAIENIEDGIRASETNNGGNGE